MPPTLFLLFNHTITPAQAQAAQVQLGVSRIVPLPQELQELWSQIPPELAEISAYLRPVREWLADQGRPGDVVLIQGDFGATYLLVNFALQHNLIPVYATTRRLAEEEQLPDGSVKLVHHFQHQIFRRYGV